MKKITLLATLALVFLSAECFAGVTFIVDSPQHSNNSASNNGYTPSYTPPSQPPATQSTETICRNKGYIRNSCPAGQYGVRLCPDDTNYFTYCCPNENKHTPQECEQQGMVAGSYNCHGLYACQPAE